MMGLKNSFLILITLIVLNAKVSHAQEYSAYDLFMRCMHTGGISYDIIKKKLPAANEAARPAIKAKTIHTS